MKPKRVIVSVINDLVTDQRVHRTCQLLHDMGYHVLLAGRRKHGSLNMDSRSYQTHRMGMIFQRGPFFYVFFNTRLLFFLLFRRSSLLISNDLDTLLPNYLISRLKRVPLIYDAHEFFTEVPELTSRPRVQRIWRWLEKRLVPGMPHMITVNNSLASLYADRYHISPIVVRNIPITPSHNAPPPSRTSLGLPKDKKIIILQGSGINIDRGSEEAVEAMQYLDDVLLLIVGGGDVINILKERVTELKLLQKVQFIPKVPMATLRIYTQTADAGLTLDKDTNLNYRYSLPNKLFDYIHAGIPILASDLPEIRNIVKGFNIGLIATCHDPKRLAIDIHKVLYDIPLRQQWKENLRTARKVLCWENEQEVLKQMISNVMRP